MRLVGFSIPDQTAKLSDGQVVPITNLFDCGGIELDRPFDEVAFEMADRLVCGPLRNGKWLVFQFDIGDFQQVPVH